MNKYAIIMAGGSGERLFPLSTKEKPKQFLNLYGQDCMINETIKRVEKIISIENIFIIINKNQKDICYQYIDRRIKDEQILLEPKALNTAVCIAYASAYIAKERGEGVVTVFSSDHYICGETEFCKTINESIELAEKENNIIIIGVEPKFPCTEFGYIQYYKEKGKFKKVKNFFEKPNIEKAKEYIKESYIWNSGMFVWNTNTIKKAFAKFLPNIYKEIYNFNFENYNEIEEIYNKLEPISIDRGIIEKAENVKTVIAKFEWMDIGNIETLFKLYEKKKINNNIINNYIPIESANVTTVSRTENKTFTMIGINNIAVIDTEENCIIVQKSYLPKVKDICMKIKKNKN